MIKRNKLSIFLLAVVLMLTVYYVNSNDPDIEITPEVSLTDNNSRYQVFQSMRDSLTEERTSKLTELEEIISSETSSLEEKEIALETMTNLSNLTEKEISLETAIINIGYKDALVEVEDKDIYISILNEEEFDVANFVELAVIAKNQFGSDYIVSIDLEN